MNAVQQRWAHDYGVPHKTFRQLLRLVEHFARLEEQASGDNGSERNKQIAAAIKTAGDEIEAMCKPLDIAVDFDTGIYPLFVKNGRREVIPHNE